MGACGAVRKKAVSRLLWDKGRDGDRRLLGGSVDAEEVAWEGNVVG